MTTAEIARRRVLDQATTGPTPRGRVATIIYKGGRLVQDSRSDKQLLNHPTSPGALCWTCAEFF